MPHPFAEIAPGSLPRPLRGRPGQPFAGLITALVLLLTSAATAAPATPALADHAGRHAVPGHRGPYAQGDTSELDQPGSFWTRQAPWRRPPPLAGPGAYVEAIDVTGAPDGSLWLLDGRGAALHRREADGLWTRFIPLPRAWTARRLSAGAELWLLGNAGGEAQLLRQPMDSGSPTIVDLGVSAAAGPVELAALPDGGLALALARPPTLELRDAQGRLAQRIDLAALYLPDCAQPLPLALAPAPGRPGELWLSLRRDESACPGGPAPDPTDLRPALVEGSVRIAGGSQPQVLAVEPGSAPLDLAERGGQLWRLDASGPSPFGAPPASPLPPSFTWLPHSLAILADGRPAVVGEGCPSGQVWSLGPDGQPQPLGQLLRPLGSAPRLPLRLAAVADQVWSLEGRSDAGAGGRALDGGAPGLLGFSGDGRLRESRPLCDSTAAEADPVDLLAGDQGGLRLLPTGLKPLGDGLPTAPIPALPGALLGAWWGAAATAGGRLALLDLAGPRVLALDSAGQALSPWIPGGLPSDLALVGRFAYLSDPLARRVEVRDLLSGSLLHSFRSHLPLLRLEAEPGGDGLLGLATGDWALRYSLDGRLTAAWPLARAPGSLHTDLLPLPGGGSALAGRLRLSPPAADGDWSQALPVDAGLDPYVSSTTDALPPDLTAGEACVVHGLKQARPERIHLGQSIEVELRLDGLCPSSVQEGRLLLLLDPASGQAGQASLAGLLPLLDDQRLSLGLVTLQGDQVLDLPPPSSAALLRSLGLRADLGGARLPAALARAVDRLAGGGGGGPSRLVLLLGRPPAPEQLTALRLDLERARRAGIAITALVHGRPAVDAAARAAWAPLFAAGEAQWSIRPFQLPLFAPRLAPSVAQPAFQRLTVVDRLPTGLAPQPGSIEPPDAVWDDADGTLTWQLDTVNRDEVTLRYRLRPLASGRQAAGGEGAAVDYRDGFGYQGRLGLPRPIAFVEAPSPIHLPYLARGHCAQRRPPLDLLLVLDLSGSMAERGIDGRSKLAAAVDAALGLADLLDWQRDRVALVGFSAAGQLLSPLSGDAAALRAALAGLATAEGTRIDLGLGVARQAWEASPRAGARSVLILLTDGRQDDGLEPAALAQAAALRSAGVTPYGIGLGPDHDAALLTAIAGSPDRYLPSPDPAALAERFGTIFARESCAEPPNP